VGKCNGEIGLEIDGFKVGKLIYLLSENDRILKNAPHCPLDGCLREIFDNSHPCKLLICR